MTIARRIHFHCLVSFSLIHMAVMKKDGRGWVVQSKGGFQRSAGLKPKSRRMTGDDLWTHRPA